MGGDYGNREREIFRSDFNPLHPCGRRHHRFIRFTSTERFQSTPPVWAETFILLIFFFAFGFQSTPPVWAETYEVKGPSKKYYISIHSTRVGGDGSSNSSRVLIMDFNPLHPCGRRHVSTTSARFVMSISIHSTRVGGDLKQQLHINQ